MKGPSKAELARALGISAPAFTRYVKRGCPLWSVEAAREWQAQHIHPAQRAHRSRAAVAASESQAVAQAVAAVRILSELAASDFDTYADRLRAAMRAVPLYARPAVQLDLDVFRRLLPVELPAVLEADDGVPQTDADNVAAGLAVYALAAGELRVTLP
jgi:hypothetical protein